MEELDRPARVDSLSAPTGVPRRAVLQGGTAAAVAVVAAGFGAVAAVPASAAAGRTVVLRSPRLEVTLDAGFPRVVGYRWTATGDTLGGSVNTATTVSINGQDYVPEVAVLAKDESARYRLTVAELSVTVDLRFRLTEDVLRVEADTIVENGAVRVSTFGLPGLGLVSVSAAQGGRLSHCALQYGLGKPTPADVFTTVADAAGDGNWHRTSYALLDTGRLAAAVESWTCADDRLLHRTSTGQDGEKHTELASGEWVYRGADGKVFALPEAAVVVTADRNGDGVADWQDAAIAFRGIMRAPHAPDWARTKVVQGIAINLASHGHQPFLTVLDEIRRTSLYTDGLPQAILLKGYRSEGHDSGHMEYATPYNARAGGRADLRTLTERAKEWNAEIGVHINAWEAYPESASFRWDRSNGPGDPGWRWMDQSWHTDVVKDQATGAFAARFKKLVKDLPELGFVYSDTYWTGGWHAARQAAVITGHGLPLGAEGDGQFERDSVFTYAGQNGHGLGSRIIRFIRHTQRDAWVRHPLLHGADNTHYLGWQQQKNLKAWLKSTFVTNLPTKFLQQFEILRWTEKELDLTDGVHVSTATGVTRITWHGRLLGDGDTLFIPWDFAKESDPRKIYHWNPTGGATTWELPAHWAKARSLLLYRLTEQGRSTASRVPVKDGKVTVEAEAQTPYVLYRAEPEPQPAPRYGSGGLLAHPAFTGRTLEGWTARGTARVTDDGDGLPYLRIDAPEEASVSQRVETLPAGTYAASVWVRVTGSRKAVLSVTGAGIKGRDDDGRSGPVAANWTDSSPLRCVLGNGRRRGTMFQRMRVLFTVIGNARATVELTLRTDPAAAGNTVDFADVRLVPLPGADPEFGGHWYAEDFEHIDEGLGPFVPASGDGERSHLSETHKGYTRDTISGRYSLKTLSETAGIVYRTLPQTLRFLPNRTYRVTFDYQADPGSDYRVVLGRDGGAQIDEEKLLPTTDRKLDTPPLAGDPTPPGWNDSLPPQNPAPHRTYVRTFRSGPASDGAVWLGIKRVAGDAFVLDNLIVDDLGASGA
ncbi:endo-alpha-N-acetylgalactosaminidase family protein [Streptomyces sp. NBC_00057]|uniref:endo-alpha-N-acetylgalactosaminidase family protein n=1 Tax=Streptomyces sp. NBC_00057 TaxID=2975634 RepID=UPI003255AB9B